MSISRPRDSSEYLGMTCCGNSARASLRRLHGLDELLPGWAVWEEGADVALGFARLADRSAVVDQQVGEQRPVLAPLRVVAVSLVTRLRPPVHPHSADDAGWPHVLDGPRLRY